MSKISYFCATKTQKEMCKNLIIIVLAFMAMPVFSQDIETVDIKNAPDGKFSITLNDRIIEGNVRNGLREGTWMEYNVGSYLPKQIVSYEKGKKNGVYVEIDKTGSIVKKAVYKDDRLDGQVCEWYRGGRLTNMSTYKDGQLDGEQVVCYEKGGNLEVSNYKDGQRDGLTTWYYESGQKKMSIEYKNGQFEGKQKTFYPNGSLKSEANYKGGKLQGKVKTYDEQPTVQSTDEKKKR